MPSLADLVGGETGDLLVPVLDAALVDGVDRRDQVEDRGFARAVGADETYRLLLVHREVEVFDDLQSPEVLVDPRQSEERRPGRHQVDFPSEDEPGRRETGRWYAGSQSMRMQTACNKTDSPSLRSGHPGKRPSARNCGLP